MAMDDQYDFLTGIYDEQVGVGKISDEIKSIKDITNLTKDKKATYRCSICGISYRTSSEPNLPANSSPYGSAFSAISEPSNGNKILSNIFMPP